MLLVVIVVVVAVFVLVVWHKFPGRPEVLEHDVPLLVHGGPLELCVGLVVPVPEVEPTETSVEPGGTVTNVTRSTYTGPSGPSHELG